VSQIEYDVTTNRTRRIVSVVFHQSRILLAQVDMTVEQLDVFVQLLQDARASLPPPAVSDPSISPSEGR
jgi:hypothetical protein